MDKKTADNKKVDKNTEKISELEHKLSEMEKNWIRALADYKNLEKRVTQDKITLIEFANSVLIENLLPVLDNFEMLVKHTEDEGIKISIKEFKNVMTAAGLIELETNLGDGFNPETMDAIESTSGDKNTVVEIIRKGYNFKNSQIRPVSVKVGNGKKPEPEKGVNNE